MTMLEILYPGTRYSKNTRIQVKGSMHGTRDRCIDDDDYGRGGMHDARAICHTSKYTWSLVYDYYCMKRT